MYFSTGDICVCGYDSTCLISSLHLSVSHNSVMEVIRHAELIEEWFVWTIEQFT